MDRTLDRRAFLLGTAGTLVAASTLADEPKKDDVLQIIDTHEHLWDLTKFKLPWHKDQPTLAKSFVSDDYLKAIGELAQLKPPAKVVKSVYMEVDVAPEQQQAEADYVVDICKRGGTPMVAAVVSGRPNSEGFAKYVKPFRDSKYIKGVRQVLHQTAPSGYCLDKKFVQGIQLLGEVGLSFDLCMRPTELNDAAKLIDHCPGTRFILDHCGNAPLTAGKDQDQWRKDIGEVAKRKNVVVKISGIVASATPGKWKPDDLAPAINHTMDAFGPDRVMFAGDWPVCTLAASFKQWVEALRTVVQNRKPEEQRKLFHDNAARFYGI